MNLTLMELCELLTSRVYNLEKIIEQSPSWREQRLLAFGSIEEVVGTMRDLLAKKEENIDDQE